MTSPRDSPATIPPPSATEASEPRRRVMAAACAGSLLSSANRFVERARCVYRSHGALEVLKRASFQVLKYDRQLIYALDGGDDGAALPANVLNLIDRVRGRFSVQWLIGDSLAALPSYLAYRRDLSADQVGAWLRDGHGTVVVSRKGKIIGDGWLALRSFPFSDTGVASRLAGRGYAFSFLANVLPQYRGLGVFPLVTDEQLRLMRREGRGNLFSTVSPTNMRSRLSVEKMGFHCVGMLHVCWFLGRRFAKARLDRHWAGGVAARANR